MEFQWLFRWRWSCDRQKTRMVESLAAIKRASHILLIPSGFLSPSPLLREKAKKNRFKTDSCQRMEKSEKRRELLLLSFRFTEPFNLLKCRTSEQQAPSILHWVYGWSFWFCNSKQGEGVGVWVGICDSMMGFEFQFQGLKGLRA